MSTGALKLHLDRRNAKLATRNSAFGIATRRLGYDPDPDPDADPEQDGGSRR
jgi:hypothetical protein